MVRTRAQNYSIASSSSESRESLVADEPLETMVDTNPTLIDDLLTIVDANPTPFDAIARKAVEHQQSTIEQISALLRGSAPANFLVPPSAAELQSFLVKNLRPRPASRSPCFPLRPVRHGTSKKRSTSRQTPRMSLNAS
eukprot:GHVT01097852.1.p1 GENE.GHVT01097852.1~~GHVT01097852.1.p1  ORF type:complete len:139 (-),score=5.50 GHVT01097852.1:208-624(-)